MTTQTEAPGKDASVKSLTYVNPLLSYEALKNALKKASERPTLSQFDSLDVEAAREGRMKVIAAGTNVEGTSQEFAEQLAQLHWLRTLPVVEEIADLPAKHKGPFWVFSPNLCAVSNMRAEESVLDDNGELVLPDLNSATVLQRCIGFNYFAKEIRHAGRKLLALRVKSNSHFGNPKLPNVTLVFTYEDRDFTDTYEDAIGSLTRFPVERSLPVGLLLDD